MIVDELNLPAANITRITRAALPPATKLSKEAREGLTRAASIFILYVHASNSRIRTPYMFSGSCVAFVCMHALISYGLDFSCLTNAASEASTSEKRQTIQTKDIFTALEDMDLGDLVPEVQQRLKETSKGAAPSKSSKASSPSSKSPHSKASGEGPPEDRQVSAPGGDSGSGVP